jgi:hypothetical protein
MVPRDVMADAIGREDFAGRGEIALGADEADRVVLGGVGAGDIVQARGRDHGPEVVVGAAANRLDDEALVVAEQAGDIVELLGRIELDDAIALGVIDVHDGEGEALGHFGGEQQARAVHRIAEGEVEREIVGAGVGFVGGEEDEGLVGTLLEFHLA